jgi:hypothetical protein
MNRLLPWSLHLSDRRRWDRLGIHLLSLRVVRQVIASRDIGNLTPVALAPRRHCHLWRGVVLHAPWHSGAHGVAAPGVDAWQACDLRARLDASNTWHSWYGVHIFICHAASYRRDTGNLAW